MHRSDLGVKLRKSAKYPASCRLSQSIVNKSNLPAIRPYLPSDGAAFHTDRECPLADVSADLCQIASFLQNHVPSAKLERFHDWWEHDALHFPHGETDYHGLFQLVGTPRSLIESMTGDHRVFIALSPKDRNWYLRFFADWDDGDTNMIGEFSITLDHQLVDPFLAKIALKFKCSISREDVLTYFQRIEA